MKANGASTAESNHSVKINTYDPDMVINNSTDGRMVTKIQTKNI